MSDIELLRNDPLAELFDLSYVLLPVPSALETKHVFERELEVKLGQVEVRLKVIREEEVLVCGLGELVKLGFY